MIHPARQLRGQAALEARDPNARLEEAVGLAIALALQRRGLRVSGRAVLSAFTVNHRFAMPGLAAPYVIAQVAIEEDPRVRLTTNIVECDPDELELGRVVEVVFEQNEDTWLPLFRPTTSAETGPLPDDEIAPQDFAEHIRPMIGTDKFEERSAITGIGASRQVAQMGATQVRASTR